MHSSLLFNDSAIRIKCLLICVYIPVCRLNSMGTSSGANFHQHQPPLMVPPLNQHPPAGRLQTSLSLVPVNSANHSPVDRGSNSPSESSSSRETWPMERKPDESETLEPKVVHRISTANRLSLREIVRERVETVAEKMLTMPNELLEDLKSNLRLILESPVGSSQREELLILQRTVQTRTDLTEKVLSKSHRVQLEILTAIKTGIQAFLHPTISLPQGRMIEIFSHKRCRNVACQGLIPGDDCSCDICSSRKDFCNQCMCVICNKFDFEANTCRWIGCDLCTHWTHTDCAIRTGLVSAAPEMMFRCQACNRSSELLGWVKDVFQHCSPNWNRESLARELDLVSRIFASSEDPHGRKLLWKCGDLLEKLKSGIPESAASRMMAIFFQGMYWIQLAF